MGGDEAKKSRAWFIIKRVLLALACLLFVAGAGGGIYAHAQTSAYDDSVNKIYDVPPPTVVASSDAAVIARGKHLAESIAGCAVGGCHGADLGGGTVTNMGPVGSFVAPNITPGGIATTYTDGELARLIRHGIKKDGRTVRFMMSEDFNWLPDSDVAAIVSYVRQAPRVDRPNQTMEVKMLGKILDRKGLLPVDIARKIDHGHIEIGPSPSSTAAYGSYIARLCTGCHGKTLSGGPIPGAPSDFAVPLNITPHETGLKGWTFDDFEKLAKTGVRKNGATLSSVMPIEALSHMDDMEKHALWAYLQSVPAVAFGGR